MKKIFLILILFLFTGCSSYIELNDLAIINAIGIEKVNNTYKMYASIIMETDKETTTPKTTIYEVTGVNLNDMLNQLTLTLNKKIYLSHLDLFLLNDTIKTQEFTEIINFFLNNNETREDFLVICSKNIKELLEKTNYGEINDLVEINRQEASQAIYTTMYDVINNFTLQEPIYFTNLEITEHVKIKGLKVFLNNNYQEILENDSLFLNYLLNNINTYKYNYSCQDNKFLYLNILASTTNENEKEFFIANELKVITNDCNLKKDEINNIFTNYLKTNLEKFTEKKLTIKNTIRGLYENK